MIDTFTAVLTLLADDAPRNSGPDFGKASPLGLVIVVLLLVGTFALVWSMNRQLKKVPASFDEPETEPTAGEPTDDTGTDPRTPPSEPGG